MKYAFLLIISFFVFSCNTKSELEKEIEKIPVTVDIIRFDKEFATAGPSDLERLKSEFPVFFPKQFHDSIWLFRMSDTLQRQLSEEVVKKFPSEEMIADELYPLFQHIKYYFPQFRSPTILTTTSDVDYNNKVILSDSLLILSLDNYLGTEHEFYGGIKKYIAQNLKESQLAPDVAEAYARQLVSKPRQRSLLAQMIFFGKELYLKEIPAMLKKLVIPKNNWHGRLKMKQKCGDILLKMKFFTAQMRSYLPGLLVRHPFLNSILK